MSGHHSFDKLRAELSDERKERIAKKTEQLRQEMALHELRQARQMTQAAQRRTTFDCKNGKTD